MTLEIPTLLPLRDSTTWHYDMIGFKKLFTGLGDGLTVSMLVVQA